MIDNATRAASRPATDEQMHKMWRMDASYAASELTDGPWNDDTVTWWEPHLVYVLHLEEEQLFKVGLTRYNSRRLKDLMRLGSLVATHQVSNRWVARIVEIEILRRMNAHRQVSTKLRSEHGRHECWSDAISPPDLAVVTDELAEALNLKHWSTSLNASVTPQKNAPEPESLNPLKSPEIQGN